MTVKPRGDVTGLFFFFFFFFFKLALLLTGKMILVKCYLTSVSQFVLL